MDKPLEFLVNDIHKPAEVRTIAHSSYQDQMEKYITSILKPGQWMKAPYYENEDDTPRVDDADGNLESLTRILQGDPFNMGIDIANDTTGIAVYIMDNDRNLHTIPVDIYSDPGIDGRDWPEPVEWVAARDSTGRYGFFTDDELRLIRQYSGGRPHQYNPEGSDWLDAAEIYEKTGLPEVNAPHEPKIMVPPEYNVTAFPNPSNGLVNIIYRVPENGNVFLRVYDIDGRLVKKIQGSFHKAGEYSAVWNAEGIPSGQYLIHMNAGKHKETKPVQVIR